MSSPPDRSEFSSDVNSMCNDGSFTAERLGHVLDGLHAKWDALQSSEFEGRYRHDVGRLKESLNNKRYFSLESHTVLEYACVNDDHELVKLLFDKKAADLGSRWVINLWRTLDVWISLHG